MYKHFVAEIYCRASYQSGQVLISEQDTEGKGKGLCPCPRGLVPKSKLDQTGTKHDSKFRLQNVCTYLFNYVRIAQNAIYESAAAIAGAVVNRLLKVTSSVPTLVSQVP